MGFTQNTKNTIKENSLSMCSMCRVHTTDGEIAHIVSLANTGPRSYKSNSQFNHLTHIDAEKIFNHENNGLYLCRNCHRNIDKYPDKYTTRQLNELKNLTRYDNNIRNILNYQNNIIKYKNDLDDIIKKLHITRTNDELIKLIDEVSYFINIIQNNTNEQDYLDIIKILLQDFYIINILLKNDFTLYFVIIFTIKYLIKDVVLYSKYYYEIIGYLIGYFRYVVPSQKNIEDKLKVLKWLTYLIPITNNHDTEIVKGYFKELINIDNAMLSDYCRMYLSIGNAIKAGDSEKKIEKIVDNFKDTYAYTYICYPEHFVLPKNSFLINT